MAWGKKQPKPKATPAPSEGPKDRFMGLYKITYGDSQWAWAGTKADAKAKAKELGGEWAEEDVPVSKQALLDFLNEHVTGKDEPEA